MIRFSIKPPPPPKYEWKTWEVIFLFTMIILGLGLLGTMIYFFPPPQK